MDEQKLGEELRQIALDIGMYYGNSTRFHQIADKADILEAKLEAMERHRARLIKVGDALSDAIVHHLEPADNWSILTEWADAAAQQEKE